ncbi:hypothetical protein X732_30800 [Mesorhizobium sp. L2C066B000]|nr:hypothetical protein X732_30800 [Mesorhizobium sp. L2C066B000]
MLTSSKLFLFEADQLSKAIGVPHDRTAKEIVADGNECGRSRWSLPQLCPPALGS